AGATDAVSFANLGTVYARPYAMSLPALPAMCLFGQYYCCLKGISMAKTLDRVDRRILDELQGDARVANQELAKRVGLSPAPCWRRLRHLEEEGFIYGE